MSQGKGNTNLHWVEKVPWERLVLGVAVIWGFVAIINYMLTNEIPGGNKEIVLSMTAVLGTALGAVIGAVFRSNTDDSRKNETINTLANAAAAPMTITTEVRDGSQNSGGAAASDRGLAGGIIEPIEDTCAADELPAGPPSTR